MFLRFWPAAEKEEGKKIHGKVGLEILVAVLILR